MKSFKLHILVEDVRSKVNKLKNLNRAEKKRLSSFFKSNPHLESEIDWNDKNLDITDFQVVLHIPSKSKTKKKIKKEGIRGLKEGIDYVDFTGYFGDYYAYMPLSHEASKHIADKYIGKCTGKWCISYQKDDYYWNSHTKQNIFIILVHKDTGNKYTIQIDKDTYNITIWDKDDNIVKYVVYLNIYNVVKKIKNKITKAWNPYRSNWVEKAKTKNAKYYIDDENKVTWKSGTWKSGAWRKGTWERGTWESGIWHDGEWKYGTWESGTWEYGTWKNGEWYKGVWKGGTWKDGTWEGGTWNGGTWKHGTWRDGTWKYGAWEGGTWLGGYDRNGDWHPEGDSPDKW
jgi:hypothetical protein